MPATISFHLKADAAFSTRVHTHPDSRKPFRVITVADGAANDVLLFLSDEQARELASTILTALYPETAAMAEAVGETVQ